VFRTITAKQLQQTIRNVLYSENFAHRMIEEGGFEDVIDEYATEIAAGLASEHLPTIDEAIMREIGSQSHEVELRLLVGQAKKLLERQAKYSEGQFVQMVRLDDLEKRLQKAVEEFEPHNGGKSKDVPQSEHPKKTRRWFKGLGQIGQGSALTIANVGVAASIFHLPVSPETQTWGP